MKMLWVLAILISLFFGLVHVFGFLGNKNYTPFAVTGISKGGGFDESYCYIPPINAAYWGKKLTDWQTWEYRDLPGIQPLLGPLIFGPVARAIGLENLYVIADFIFPPLVFLLFYFLTKAITKNNLVSVLAGLLLLAWEPLWSFGIKLAAYFIRYPGSDYFANYLNTLNRPLKFARFDNPQFSFIVLILTLLFFWQAIKTKKTVYYVLFGFFTGLQWYIYSYYAIFASFLLIFAFFLQIIPVLTLVVFALSSFLYWHTYWQFIKLPQAMDFLIRAGRENGRWFNSIFFPLFLAFILIILSKFKKNLKKEIIFLLTLLLAAIFCLNFQLFSGFSVQHFHWQTVIVDPVLILTISFLLSQVIIFLQKHKNWSLFLKFSLFLLIIFLLSSLFFRNFLIARNTYKAYEKNLKLEEAFNWINNNVPDNSVIMTPSPLTNYWLIMSTKAYLYTPHSLHSLAPTDELVERMAITFDIFNLDKKYAGKFLAYYQSLGITPYTLETINLSGYQYLFYLKYNYGNPPPGYLTFFQESNFSLSAAKNKYKLDYLFYGPFEKQMGGIDFKQNNNLTKVFDNAEVRIYQVN